VSWGGFLLYISYPKQDMNDISTATLMFLGSSHPMRSIGMLYDGTESGKSNMAASKRHYTYLCLCYDRNTLTTNNYV